LAEVDITAMFEGSPMIGKIDRLVVRDDTVLAVDYKSNQLIPVSQAEVPDGLLRQMAAYRAALAQIYPDRRIETALLWTRSAVLMPIS
jgi:ATP-dependent helicase/nuclease subunit A